MTERLHALPLLERTTGTSFLTSPKRAYAFQKIAADFGVTCTILQRPGEEYVHHLAKDNSYRGVVPADRVYMSVDGSERNRLKFWEEVTRLENSGAIAA